MSETKGVMGIIGCPMLEDELIYDMIMDPQEKVVYLVDTEPAKSLREKFDMHGISYTMIDAYSFTNGIDDIDHEKYNMVILMNDLGLHAEPKDLKAKLEEQVLMVQNRFDVITLFYGSCGNAMWDISKWAKDKELAVPVVIFRDDKGRVCDDCIGVAVGGYERYFKLLKTYTGMLLLTPAMATNWEDFLASSEMMRGVTGGSHETMRLIFELCGYKYAVKIDTGIGDREKFQSCAETLCKEMNLELTYATDEWGTVELAKKIYRESKDVMPVKS